MLNAKALSELLSKNSDDRLCKRWFLMTPNGTVLAYSQPTNVRELRKQAAMAALSWQEHQGMSHGDQDNADTETANIKMPGLLRTLTVESESANLIVRKLQPQMLLVLEGGIPPRRRTFEPRVTPEGPGDVPYPSLDRPNVDSVVASSASSVAESSKSSATLGILGMQRRKLDVLASALAQDFERTGFKMPEETGTKYF